ncbi:efflux RND transporter periplasmic adaptor subunit [Bacteroides rodentium]
MNRILFPIFLCTVLLGACSAPAEAPKTTSHELFLTDSLKSIVSIDTVALYEVTGELTLNGRVTFNQEQVARVFPIFGGTVTEVSVEIGDHVRKGDVLATIRSGEVADYEKQSKEAEQQFIIARRNLQSVQDMAASGMASERDVLQAEQEMNNAEAEVKRISEIFSIYHISGKSLYQLKAPVSGFIVDKNINKEMQLRSDQSDEVFIISGLENVWVMADVYEGDISKVRENASVRITTLAYPGKEFTGKIDKVYNMLDTESKTMNVRIKLANSDYLLKPGMFTNVCVQSKVVDKELPCIDAHALVFEGGKNYVVMVDTNKKLTVKEVQVYRQSGKVCYLSAGVSAGDCILNQNALLVYNALNID